MSTRLSDVNMVAGSGHRGVCEGEDERMGTLVGVNVSVDSWVVNTVAVRNWELNDNSLLVEGIDELKELVISRRIMLEG